METYTLTVKFADRGTLLDNGDRSGPGHVWVELQSSTGQFLSTGWYPGENKFVGGVDNLSTSDYKTYIDTPEHPIRSITVAITKEQFERAFTFPDRAANGEIPGFRRGYDIINNSCIDYAGLLLSDIRLADSGFDGSINPKSMMPYQHFDSFKEQLERHAAGWIFTNKDGKEKYEFLARPWYGNEANPWVKDGKLQIPQSEQEQFSKDYRKLNRSGKYHKYDPLALDLDGDGIEIRASSPSGGLFDHDADGIRTAGGWLSGDDGWLVYDRNNNGHIDSGRELFGDHTLLSDGSRAAHGYAALAELDDNGDGVVNLDDTAFALLQIWRDLNQDGISQSGELFSLADAGVAALNLAHTTPNQNLGNGNFLAQSGSYTQTDGSSAQMGDLDLAADHLFSRFTDSVELTAEQMQAPNLQGMGRLRDLREAAALSPELAGLLQRYAAASTKTEQLALQDELIEAWAKTDTRYGSYDPALSLPAAFGSDGQGNGNPAESWSGRNSNVNSLALTPTQIQAIREGRMVLSDQTLAGFEAVKDKIKVLDAFTGQDSRLLGYGTEEQARNIIKTVSQTYDNLVDNLYRGLLFQTRLQPYLNEIGFKLNEQQQFVLDYADVQTKFQQIFKDNAQKAFVDLGEFLAFGGMKDWTAGMSLLADFAKKGKESGQLQDWLKILGDQAATILSEQNGDTTDNVLQAVSLLGRDVLNGNAGNDRLLVGNATAIVNGGAGSDVYEFHSDFGATTIRNHDASDNRHDVVRLHGVSKDSISYTRNGNDLMIHVAGEQNSITVSNMFAGDVLTQHIDAIEYDGGQISLTEIKETLLRGTDGNDFLQGYGDDDTVHAGAGDDRIETYNGNDTIYAGLGDDTIDAGGGNDMIYLETGRNRAYGGDGDDTLISGHLKDVLEGGIGSDTYIFGKQFGQDTVLNFNPHQQDKDILKFTHTQSRDVIIHRNEADLLITQKDGQQVTVQNFFEKDGKGDYTIQSIEFADGQQLNTEQLRQWVINPTRGDDRLYAYADGGKIHGGNGNDTLIGHQGIDFLVGDWGNDTLSGGQNHDRLEGGMGDDTYLFGIGDGNDRIYDSFGKDTLKLDNGIDKQDLWFSRNGRDLSIQVLGQTDSITVEDWFGIIPRRIETIQTHDGANLDVSAVQKLVQAMASFAPQQDSGLSLPEQMKEYARQILVVNNL